MSIALEKKIYTHMYEYKSYSNTFTIQVHSHPNNTFIIVVCRYYYLFNKIVSSHCFNILSLFIVSYQPRLVMYSLSKNNEYITFFVEIF